VSRSGGGNEPELERDEEHQPRYGKATGYKSLAFIGGYDGGRGASEWKGGNLWPSLLPLVTF